MVDREKVVGQLERISEWLFQQYSVVYDGDAPNYYESYKAVDDAIAMLKVQEAVEPIVYSENITLPEGVAEVSIAYCGYCKKQPIAMKTRDTDCDNYCPRCGRQIKWMRKARKVRR